MQKKILAGENLELAAAILSCIGDGVISTNTEGKIIYINQMAEEITGWKADEAIGKKFEKIFTTFKANTKERLESPIHDVLEHGISRGLENNTVIISKNHIQKYVSATCTPVQATHGAITGVVVVFRDITRLKTLEIEHINEKNNLKTIFNYAPVGMITLNGDRMIHQINDAALLLTNKDRTQVMGRTFGESFNCIGRIESEKGCGYGLQCPNCEIRKAVDLASKHGQVTSNIEFSKVMVGRGKEKEYWFRTSVTPIIVDGKTNVVVTLLDITEKKKEELSLIQSIDYCNNLLDQIPSLVWKTGMGVECDYVNKSWKSFTGFNFKESSGYGWANVVHPKDLDRYVKIRTDAMYKRDSFQLEVRFRRYDGVYRWCLVIGAPYYDLDGKFEGYIGSVYDITERKEAEAQLKRYQMLSENTRDIILFIDVQGRIIEANKAAVKAYGYTYEELCSMNIHDIRIDRANANKQMEWALQAGMMFETVHRRKDGSCFPVEVSSQGICMGNKCLLLSIIRDVTDRKNAEIDLKKAKEAAESANKTKSEFLANMSHEIRTPINGMVGMLDLTLLTELNDEQKDNLITAKACANALLKIINDILDFSKMEAGKLSIENNNFNIMKLVEELVKTHSPQVIAKGIELNYGFSSTIPEFLIGDGNRLRQVLNNLVSNGIKFTDHGSINLSVKKIAQVDDEIELKFAVSDTGEGIDPDNIGKLFTSFHQIHDTFTRKVAGTGLGLAISKQLVEMMGGKIGVESEKGKGSTFYFQLKFKIGSKEVKENRQLYKISKTSRPLQILLVEDDEINQKVIRKMLKEKGHLVESANSGKEALDLFRKRKYDVILMDIQMPEMDGIEVTKRIREEEKAGNHTPIIALTAYALQGDREKFLSLGMDDYISKPIQMNELLYILDRITLTKGRETSFLPDKVIVTEEGEIEFLSKNIQLPKEKIIAVFTEIEEYMKDLDSFIKTDDLMSIEILAHKIKELSNEIDLGEMKDAAFKIELAARRCNCEDTVKYVKKIRHKFQVLKESII